MSLIAKFLGLALLFVGLSAHAGFIPKKVFFCAAFGSNNTEVVEVIGGAAVNDVEAADMTLNQCEVELGLQGCALDRCWSEPVNQH